MSSRTPPIYLEDEDAVLDATRECKLPLPTNDIGVEDRSAHVGKTVVFSPGGGGYELRPLEECPHCGSWSYRLRWNTLRDPEGRDRPMYLCTRCQLQIPFEEGYEE